MGAGDVLNLGETDQEKSVREPVDLGNHEADPPVKQTHVNDEGNLVDEDGNKVFTTTEEAIKDGSFVLDSKGRMPGIYLDDVEAAQMEDRRKRYEESYNNSAVGKNSVVERQVNVANSPLPPVTVVSKQEHPVSEGDSQSVPANEGNTVTED